mgnify:CR=1 FL=1
MYNPTALMTNGGKGEERMLSADLRETINECAREFDVKAVWLFGSSLQDDSNSRDIDLAVEGIPPELFFKFYARLFMALPKPVDLVDLSQNIPIASIIRKKGVAIYERKRRFS